MAYLSMGEAHRRITDYLSRFSDAVSSQDASALSVLFGVSSNSAFLQALADALRVLQDSDRLVERYSQLAEILSPLLRCLQSYGLGRYTDAYVALEKAANAFLQEFRNWETAWAMESMQTVALEIRLLAEKADRELSSSGKNPEKLQGAGSFLMKVFGALAGKGPKRAGALYVACQLFKVYFKLGTVHLCRSVIRSIETARIFDFEEFPVKDKVTYMYYTGRLEVYNENFLVADQKLTYALMHCCPEREDNKRMILKYLIPVKLSIGILPKQWLLQKYNLVEYSEVVTALRKGDIRLLRNALREHEDRFLRSGVFLVLEKLELQVYQRLIKKIYLLQKQKDPSKAHQVKLESIVKALRWLEMDMDIDEVECIMAILIHKNLTKGYIAHKNKVVVLSKQDPFPKLNGKPVSS
ncbi:enhanced ethylene response protein 5 [Canna indica]|uniref:Enhanced ethylene response protein 5 n=1 Tax=Canna indica TaxID=4628 RepID=A0AAQ3L523_9LILI|nr:enhanced ethylene response protein 5 [Canna indica]